MGEEYMRRWRAEDRELESMERERTCVERAEKA